MTSPTLWSSRVSSRCVLNGKSIKVPVWRTTRMTHLLDKEMNRCLRELRMLRTELPSDGSPEMKGPFGTSSIFQWVTESMGSYPIKDVDGLRALVVSLVSGGDFLSALNEGKRKMFHDLVDKCIQESQNQITLIVQQPQQPKEFEAYGLRMIIIKHYMRVRGIRSRVQEEMKMFVEMYEKTLDDGSDSKGDGADFFKYYSALRHRKTTHTRDISMYLEEQGADVARRMLIMGTHLVELVYALHKLQQMGP